MNQKILAFLVLWTVLGTGGIVPAQVSEGGRPAGFAGKNDVNIETMALPDVDREALLREDAREESKGVPYRFGFAFDVSIGMDDAGTWEETPGGGLLWRLRLVCPGAYSINLIYDRFHLPEGARFFVYSEDRTSLLGAFTSRNHLPGGAFATGFTRGSTCILEYEEPPGAVESGQIRISTVVHGYKDVFRKLDKDFGGSGSCNVNVACPEGTPWANEIRAAGMLLTANGTRFCSGALLNNVQQDQIPYFLTANHCYSSDYGTWIVMFNYQSPACTPTTNGPLTDTVAGTTLCARNSSSDFLLLQLNTRPPSRYRVFYAGWSNVDVPATAAAGIHHPQGDVKKISFENDPVISSDYDPSPYLFNSHWEISGWDRGTTEPGSSGSPLFDQNHRVVGQLHGGWASCAHPDRDYYGKFSMSWDRGTTAAARLKEWLDPNATGATELAGLDYTPEPDLVLAGSALTDTCAGGGPGGGDGTVDAGETVDLQITARNDGTATAAGVSAALTCADPLVAITRGAAAWPDLAVGSAAPNLAPGFQITIDPAAPCDAVLDLTVAFSDAAGTTWVQHLSIRVGTVPQAVLLSEAFESWPPAGWSIVNNGGNCVWQANQRFNQTDGTGGCAEADSYSCGAGTHLDTELRTPPLNLTGYASTQLTYDLYFQYHTGNGNDFADVDLSTDGGATWFNLKHYSSSQTVAETLDLSAYHDTTGALVRFRYAGANDWFCQVDDVRVIVRNPCRQTPCPALSLPAPSNLQASLAGPTGVDLTWQDNSSGETGFQIQRQISGLADWTPVATVGANLTGYRDSGLAASTSYAYRVRAVNAWGDSAWSNEASATTSGPPLPPSNLQAAVVGPTSIDLTWQDNSGDETGFNIQRKVSGAATWTTVVQTAANATSSQERYLTPNTSYDYRIQAVNSIGGSAWSDEATATSLPAGYPNTPGNFRAALNSPHGVSLSWWDTSSNETGFEIERKTGDPGAAWAALIALPAGSYFHSDMNLASATTYLYRIRAVNAAGASTWTAEVSITTPPQGPLAAPSNLYLSNAYQGRIDLDWFDNSTAESGFRIERKSGNRDDWQEIGSSTAPRYSDTGLPPVTTFCYRVRAWNASGFSDYSHETCRTTGQVTIPVAPTNLRADPLDGSRVRLGWWDNSGNENGFRIERKDGVTGTWAEIVVGPADDSVFEDEGLSPGAAYAWRVRAFNGGGISSYSNEAWVDTPGPDTFDAVIPAVAHTPGVNDTRWQTDMDLLNTGSAEAQVTLSLLLKDQANLSPETATVTVPAGCCLRLPDVLGTQFNSQNAALGLSYGGAAIRADSRFYNGQFDCGGAFGMYIPAFPGERALPGDGASLGVFHLLSYDPSGLAGFRVNIGFASASGFPTVVRIRLYDGNGLKLAEMAQPLQPFEHRQITKIHEYLHTPAVTVGSATVEVLTVGGRVHAYAMLIDNVSGDGICMAPDIVDAVDSPLGAAVQTGLLAETAGALPEESGSCSDVSDPGSVPFLEFPKTEATVAGAIQYDLYLPATAHTPGVNDTVWRTDADLLNPDPAEAQVDVALLLADQANLAPAVVRVTVPGGRLTRLTDVLGQIFHAGNAALAFRFVTGRVLVNARFYNTSSPCAAGSYGMSVQAMGEAAAAVPGRPAVFHHLSYDPTGLAGSRTNIGFVNACGTAVTVRITLYGDAGQVVGVTTHTLQPFEHRQFTRIHEHLQTPAVTAGWAAVEVLTPGGIVHPYAMVIDNISGDPVYLAHDVPLSVGATLGSSALTGTLRYVPGGRFVRGSPAGEPCRQSVEHRFVQDLRRPLAVMETEVTRGIWATLRSRQPSLPPDPSITFLSPGPDYPVQDLTAFAAILFANLLSADEGRRPCYYKDSAFTNPVDAGDYASPPVYCDPSAGGYRLPGEGEWENFARAGTTGAFPVPEPGYTADSCAHVGCAAILAGLDSIAWWCGNAGSQFRPAGLKAANAWGLRDVLGNVAEWCGEILRWSVTTTSSGESDSSITDSSYRAIRGGSAFWTPDQCRPASRRGYSPEYRYTELGFRLVRTLPR